MSTSAKDRPRGGERARDFGGKRRAVASKLAPTRDSARRQRGSVLIIVIWVCLGLVALTVYFAGSMSSELRGADNRGAEIAARQVATGGTRYAQYILSQFGQRGSVPHLDDYRAEELPVGEGSFWFVGRNPNEPAPTEPFFALVDEASKINLNTAPRAMLEMLPGITPELVDAILAWRSRRGNNNAELAGSDNLYTRLDPPRLNKAGPFETVDELRLVYGATLEILLGEDTNRNGVLEDNENDGDQSAPRDNGDGLIQPGILEYLTVYTRELNRSSTGRRRTNVSNQQGRSQLMPTLQRLFGGQRAGQINAALTGLGNQEIRSVAEFWIRSRMTPEEFGQIRDQITTTNNNTVSGLINVNTASEVVLSCIPGIGLEYAPTLVAYRAANPDLASTPSFTWLAQVLPPANIIRAGQYITDRSYQFSADVVAIGPNGRGYCRQKTVFDMTRGNPRIVFHQDITASGWALGVTLRQLIREGRSDRT